MSVASRGPAVRSSQGGRPSKSSVAAAHPQGAGAVLLTRQDLEGLQSNAYPRDYPSSSVLPLSVPVRSIAACVGVSPPASKEGRFANAGSGPAGSGSPSGWPPAPRRRTRSASLKRRPELSCQNSAQSVSAVERKEQVFNPQTGAALHIAPSAACIKQGPANASAATIAKKPSRVVRAKTVASMNRIAPEISEPQLLFGLGVQGHDVRRPPRLETKREEASPSPSLPAEARGLGADLFLQALQVSACSPQPDSEAGEKREPYEEEEWTASEEDGEARQAVGPERQEQLPERRRQKLRRGPAKGAAGGTSVDSDEEMGVNMPWPGAASGTAAASRLPSRSSSRLLSYDSDGGGSGASTPRCEAERPDEELLRRVADVLVQFYRLPGGRDHAIRFKNNVVNVVVVEESAWAGRKRVSQLEEPPMIWVRGGRVYDFHGDRGTVEEFEHDLLTRQVEDDPLCRQRRQRQGLLPFPFVALPMRERSAEEHADDKEAEGRRGRGQSHWT
eukprot:TRINITY_DN8410_c0_g1_i2.p1 TRINITY_DN8410_c0_g1~~TRINITY_DN8410_c0_g1_i2.p1  ORF type:complete len:503 (+),score=106.79 TRINITY_DN8410_c0_g1_i2:87-1595(+)